MVFIVSNAAIYFTKTSAHMTFSPSTVPLRFPFKHLSKQEPVLGYHGLQQRPHW